MVNPPRLLSSNTIKKFDCIIVGGGIVGLATARELTLRYPKLQFALVEKENELSTHQSLHNSGVVHAGIYYTPGSLKAKLCVDGLKRSYKFMENKNITHKKCGKLIVATNNLDVERLETLFERSLENGVPDVRMVSSKEIREIEPNCVGLKAIFSPETGIVDWRTVALEFAKDFEYRRGEIFTNFDVNMFEESKEDSAYPVEIWSSNKLNSKPKVLRTKYVITCTGLQSDRIALKTGCSKHPRIIPFRGDYLKLKDEKSHLVKTNIYPVPNPRLPFLGVHFTPRIDGSVWLGPNAILSLDREGYGLFDMKLTDTFDTLAYPGFWKLAFKYASFGFGEIIDNVLLERQIEQLRRFVPSLTLSDVIRGPSGIRAQALDPDGKLVDDFVIDSGSHRIGKRVMHVRNAPSPAATSSMSIARMLSDKAMKHFEWPEPECRTFV